MQNIVITDGNIDQKPGVCSTQSGTKIANFSLATSRPRLAEGRVLRDQNGYRVGGTASPASMISARPSQSTAKRA